MILIALETTGKSGSLAILDGETVIWQQQVGVYHRTAAELAVHLETALGLCNDRSIKLQGIAVAVGPGSFTGLRIAITTAKTLGYALGLPIAPIGSLAAIAEVTRLPKGVSSVLVGLNAYRGQVYAARFSRQELDDPVECRRCNQRVEVWSKSQWDRQVTEAIEGGRTVVTGDRTILVDDNSPHPDDRSATDAVGVARIANRLIEDQSVLVDAFTLSARYVKASAAEEKAAAR
jgi:tRNA threonylcarbamoyl adenosine modification protein YeaZ